MADNTGIEWTDATWNPVTGCDKVSAGCDHCYAMALAKRLKAMGSAKYQADGNPRTSGPGFGVTVHPQALGDPLRWKNSRLVFVNSMSDLFHAKVPISFIRDVFDVCRETPHHTYQVLTKRSLRLRRVADKLDWPSNLWMGVSVENANVLSRVDHLREVPAAVRFLSCEPLIGPLDGIDLTGIGWVIVGGESGHHARPMNPRWARSLRDQCQTAGIPLMFKQWGEWGPAPWKIHREPDEITIDYKARAEATCATHAFTGGLYQDDRGAWVEGFMKLDHQPWSAERDDTAPPEAEGMRRWGKKHAGRELDGREWSEYPA